MREASVRSRRDLHVGRAQLDAVPLGDRALLVGKDRARLLPGRVAARAQRVHGGLQIARDLDHVRHRRHHQHEQGRSPGAARLSAAGRQRRRPAQPRRGALHPAPGRGVR